MHDWMQVMIPRIAMRWLVISVVLFCMPCVAEEKLSAIRVSKSGEYFVRGDSDDRFVVWGVNYDHNSAGELLDEYWIERWDEVVQDFAEIKQLGANCVRVHLQVGKFLDSPDRSNEAALNQLTKLLDLAEQTGLYLDITGLACYHKANVPAWYDAQTEQERWQTQSFFWESIAKVCRGRTVVFCYDLMNEPVLGGAKAETDWLAGELDGKFFVQRLTLDLAGRTQKDVAKAWVDQMVDAIHKYDEEHLVTVGVIPWVFAFGGGKPLFYSPEVSQKLDFAAVHFYPEAGQVGKAIAALKAYDIGKPLIVEEMFPLKCSQAEMAEFVRGSQDFTDGWISFYWGSTASQLRAAPNATIAKALTASWLEHFQALADPILESQLFCCDMADAQDPPTMTHGPILGRPTDHSMGVWARTSEPCEFTVRFGPQPLQLDHQITSTKTQFGHDLTGWVELAPLAGDTQYYYQVYIGEWPQGSVSSFKTLPDARDLAEPKYNPKGLFNFKFEIGSCANQNPMHGIGHSLPTYTTMNREIANEVDFAIMNGDWLYEELRDTSATAWAAKNRVPLHDVPRAVDVMPTIVGVWENYQLYLSRGVPLSQWHRQVPSYFTFDDHELVNDIWGAGTAGRRHRRSVFRDIGTQAWYDYLGWANPTAHDAPIHFGRAELTAGSDLLVDTSSDFTQLPLASMSNLHVHWGTPTAGINEIIYDDDSGDLNSRVYDIKEIIDAHTLRLHMPAVNTGPSSYSIGRRSYGKVRVANCEIYLLDTRSHREMHDIKEPMKPGLTMLGKQQRQWLEDSMRASDAEFFFVVSSVPMMIPHSGAGGFEFDEGNKEEAWVAFLDEREALVRFWDELKRPVMVMTGDLHNSFAIRITDRVWEFCCGPHNSVNHVPQLDEDDRPATGWYDSGPRRCDIRWSSYILPDIPRLDRCYPFYCVVQVNNVFNMPQKLGGQRLVAYPHPQVILQYFDGRTGQLAYSETITADHGLSP